MKPLHSIFCSIIFSVLLFSSCGQADEKEATKTVEKLSAQKPYAVYVTKERSFYQAEKLTQRLSDMGFDAYFVQRTDSTEDLGTWYHVLCNTTASSDSALKVKELLKQKFDLEKIRIDSVTNYTDAVFELDSISRTEEKKIASKKPGLKADIYRVIQKFPENNALLVKRAYIINTPEDPDNMRGFSMIYNFETDLPRGISKKTILENTTAFSEVIYEDNLYGDQITIDIGKLRKQDRPVKSASVFGINSPNYYKTAEKYADMILSTGDYLSEEKKKITIQSVTTLYGYNVKIEPRKDYVRTYLVLTDPAANYILFCQSTDKTDAELYEMLENVGKGSGLLNYDEFYNTFNTIPENIRSNDIFIGFTIDKLDYRYAKRRGYVDWSKEMVGHWDAAGYFFNDKKGVWTYSIFDLLTSQNQNYIYGSLYASKKSDNKYAIDIYGTSGFAVYKTEMNWDTWDTYRKISEISFGINRYVVVVANSRKSWFNKKELKERAESLQFESKKDSSALVPEEKPV